MRDTRTRPAPPADPGFEVEIKSGGRARTDSKPGREPVALSPARAAAKAQAQRRKAIGLTVSALLLAAIMAWAWLANPANFTPSDAVARVNGEYISEKEITRELDLTRAVYSITKSEKALPSAASVLEDLIARKMQAQDARKAGVTVPPEQIESELTATLTRTGLTREQLETVLAKYNLRLDDFRVGLSDTLLINKYMGSYVVQGAKSAEEGQNRINEWRTNLAQTARIDRLKPAGSGPAPRVGSEAPDFTLTDLDGKEVKLSSLRGRPVMINFWATWCPPCRAEIPEIVRMYGETHDKAGYEIVAVATQSDRETVKAFAQEFKMSFPVLPDAGSQVTSLDHILPIPTTFFIDKEGIIRFIQASIVDRPTMEKWLLAAQ